MTTLTTSWFTEPTAFLGNVLQGVRLAFQGIGEGISLRSRYEELSRLSDTELSQRGIRREDIARIALGNRYI